MPSLTNPRYETFVWHTREIRLLRETEGKMRLAKGNIARPIQFECPLRVLNARTELAQDGSKVTGQTVGVPVSFLLESDAIRQLFRTLAPNDDQMVDRFVEQFHRALCEHLRTLGFYTGPAGKGPEGVADANSICVCFRLTGAMETLNREQKWIPNIPNSWSALPEAGDNVRYFA